MAVTLISGLTVGCVVYARDLAYVPRTAMCSAVRISTPERSMLMSRHLSDGAFGMDVRWQLRESARLDIDK